MIFQHFVPIYTFYSSVKKVNLHSWTVSHFYFSHSSGLRMVWYYGFNWHFLENQWICHFLRNSLATSLWNSYSIVWPMFYWAVTSLLILKAYTAYSEYKFLSEYVYKVSLNMPVVFSLFDSVFWCSKLLFLWSAIYLSIFSFGTWKRCLIAIIVARLGSGNWVSWTNLFSSRPNY